MSGSSRITGFEPCVCSVYGFERAGGTAAGAQGERYTDSQPRHSRCSKRINLVKPWFSNWYVEPKNDVRLIRLCGDRRRAACSCPTACCCSTCL